MWIYQAVILLYRSGIFIASFFNKKARLFVHGRRGLMHHLRLALPSDRPVVWFHCASLGEFEQGRPLMEAWRQRNPHHFILLTFFSPSGYEVRKDYPGADHTCYLPMDTPKNAKTFVSAIKQLHTVFFIKYEYWLNYIDAIYARGVPLYMVSGIFRSRQHFFKWYGAIFRRRLSRFQYFFLQDHASATLLESIGIEAFSVSGDTRFDRVIEIADNARPLPVLHEFCNDSLVIIAGSTWPPDEQLFATHMPRTEEGKAPRLIIAPHLVDEDHIKRIIRLFSGHKVARWSQRSNDNHIKDARVLIIDTIGLLSRVYQYGHVAYIGGGFGKGIHNTLEAATYGIPVVFGPNHRRFKEAVDLLQAGAAFAVEDGSSFTQCMMQLITQKPFREKAGKAASHYVKQHSGATSHIIRQVEIIGNKG